MPSNIIKTSDDEKKWEKAKKIAKKRGGSKNWALVVHIFQQMKKAQTKNTNVKQSAVDKSKIKLIKDEMRKAAANALYSKILNIKSVLQKNADKKFYVYDEKGEPIFDDAIPQDIIDQHYTKEQQKYLNLKSADTEEKPTRRQKEPKEKTEWQPAKPFEDHHHERMRPYIENGYNLREAAHMSGIESPQFNRINITDLSPKMSSHLRRVAEHVLHNHEVERAKSIDPKKNPETYLRQRTKDLIADTASIHQNRIKRLNDLYATEDYKNAAAPQKAKMERELEKQLKAERAGSIDQISKKIEQESEEVKRAHRQKLRDMERHIVYGDMPIEDPSSVGSTGVKKEGGTYSFNEPDIEENDYGSDIDPSGESTSVNDAERARLSDNKPTRSKIQLTGDDKKAHDYAYLMFNGLIEQKIKKAKLDGSPEIKTDAQQKAAAEVFNAMKSFDPSKSSISTYVSRKIDGAISNAKTSARRDYVPSQLEIKARILRRQGAPTDESVGETDAGGKIAAAAASVLGESDEERGSGGGIEKSPAERFRQENKKFLNQKINEMGPAVAKPQPVTQPNKPVVIRRGPAEQTLKLKEDQEKRRKALDAAKSLAGQQPQAPKSNIEPATPKEPVSAESMVSKPPTINKN